MKHTVWAAAAVLLLCIGFAVTAQGGTGGISGVITEADGVTPLSGIYVTLDGVAVSEQFYQMWTGADGVYQFPSVAPGVYVLCTDHTRYVHTCHDGKRSTQSADGITIVSGVALTNVNVRMPRRASVSGRVYAANGTGIKTSIGAWVNPAYLNPTSAVDGNTNGTYTIYLDPGTFALSAFHTTYGRTFYGGGQTRAEADLITVGFGDVLTGIDIHYAQPGSITGVITEADPAGGVPVPIPNATVSIYRQSSGIVYATALTDAAGVFHIFNVATDVYRLDVAASGYVTEIYNDVPSLGYASYIVVHPAPAIQTANLQLERTGDVTGRVYAPDGVTPLANRRVRWQSDFESGTSVCTNAAGDYTIPNAPLNRLFYVNMEGYRCDNVLPTYRSEFWDNSRTMTNADPLWANETNPVTGINFVAEAVSIGDIPPTNEGGGGGVRDAQITSIEGSIYAPDGITPIAGWVDIYRTNGQFVRAIGVTGNGAYGFQFIQPGTYLLRARPQGYLAEYYHDAESLEDATPVSVAASEQVRQIDFVTNPGAEITGTIYDSATGLPALYPQIRVVDSSGHEVDWGGTANDDGTYQVIVPPGMYAIFADNVTYGAGRFYGGAATLDDAVYVEAVAGTPTHGIDITLGRRGEVTGTVFAPDGATGVANVSVRISQPGLPFSYTTCTNSQGIYRHTKAMLDIANLVRVEGYCDGSPFPYIAEYWEDVHEQGAATPVLIHDRQRYATGINFTLDLGGSISGTVTGGGLPGSDDEPVVSSSGVVNVYEANSNPFAGTAIATVATHADGTYTVLGLPAGSYRVMATASGYVQEYYQERFSYQTAPPVSISVGTPVTGIDIELDPAMTISGTVTELDGVTPVENIPVYFVANGYEIIFFCTNSDGQYTIDIAPTNAVFRVYALNDPQPEYSIFPCGSDLNHYFDPQDPDGFDPYYYHPQVEPLKVNFALETGGRIAGRVTRPDGITPISGASVAIYAPDEIYPRHVQTDDDGNYVSFVVSSGDGYRVGVESLGRVREAFYGGTDYASADDVTVTVGQTTSNIDFTAPYMTGSNSLSGTARAGDGITPLDSVQVSLYDSQKRFFDVTTTNSSGGFSFGALPAGVYYLYADHSQFQAEYYQNQSSFNTMTPINVTGAVAGVEIVFNGTISVSGTIRDELTGLPMPGVFVDVTGPGGTGTISAEDGTYKVYLSAPGTYYISALSQYDSAAGSYRQPLDSEQSTPVQVSAGDQLTGLDVFLPRTGEITGSVTAAGTGLSCVSVSASLVGVSGSNGASTNANGKYWVSLPLTGSYIASADASVIGCGSDGYISEYWQEAPSEALATPILLDYKNRVRGGIDFTLVPVGTPVTMNGGVTLQGRPDAPDPSLSIPVRVVITPDAGGAAVYDQTIQTDEDSTFTVSGITPGRYQVWVKGERTLAVKQIVTLAAGPTEVNFGLLRAGDADGSNSVILTDFSILANTFGKQSGDAGYDARADFNGDGVVNLIDFSLLASNFGQAGAAP